MARTSKFKSPKHANFEVYTDHIPTPNSTGNRIIDDQEGEANNENGTPSFREDPERNSVDRLLEQDVEYKDDALLEDIEASLLAISANNLGEQTDTSADADDEGRRESAFTTASISSMPESTLFGDEAVQYPYTPSSIRPTIRHTHSLIRMQATPKSFERSPTKRSVLHGRSRPGTPRANPNDGSSRSRRQHAEEQKKDDTEYPLVLLHLTLLPISLRWSESSMQDVLPQKTLANLHLLRSKISETILQRGILVPHPRGELELLEERLLEALELQAERVTKCGHFMRGSRASTSSLSSTESEGSVHSAADSGVELPLDSGTCETCYRSVKSPSFTSTSDGSKWSIKVYASNGLMRSSAWASAWSEMERVDVEILPWISDDLRKSLDARAESDEQDERQRLQKEEKRFKAVVEEQVRIAHESEMTRRRVEETNQGRKRDAQRQIQQEPPAARATFADLPRVYRRADVPLSILLRNYIYLLARDKRNIAIFVLGILTAWLSLGAAGSPPSRFLPSAEFADCSTRRNVQDPIMMGRVGPILKTAADKRLPTSSVQGPSAEKQQQVATIVLRSEQDSLTTSVSTGICQNPAWPGELFDG